ncbi:Uu.00g013930.m01.CDS01 [Anthostomella pinea]|uniref:Uu.00g013930.m01.CDS01 n=1 Tax=Anthostomella pinea TaxID=933095 RepID=A0AAI8VYX2_9PEZI|nr:Uu.00g013930.m01.CDS01 [Anthostomella pinea]
MSHSHSPDLSTFDGIYTHLTTTYHYPVLPSPSLSPHEKSLTHSISCLSIHPTLEALLHILNADLTSAHFLCRHMQNEPAWEAMYIHGLLHRVEGDYRNAEAWYGNVADSEVFRSCWPGPGGSEEARGFIRRVEALRKEKIGDEKKLEEDSKREIERLVEWCRDKFGIGKVEDARSVWVEPSEEHRQMAAKMVVGGEGWRQF